MKSDKKPMGTWKPSSDELVEIYHQALQALPMADLRKMFGYPCAFINNQMFSGLHQENMILRLGEKERRQLIEESGAVPFEPMPGRVMKEYVVVPPALLKSAEELKKSLVHSFSYAQSLLPKSVRRVTKKHGKTAGGKL